MRAKLVRESLNEEQDYGDNNPRIHRDSKYDWPDTGEETEIEVPDISPAGEPNMGSKVISDEKMERYNWIQDFFKALCELFPLEDEENVYTLVDLASGLQFEYEDDGKTPEEAAQLIADDKKLVKEWEIVVADGQEYDEED